ncbi:hypothetical protein SAMN02746089_01824 [Caldanaerobius fijiensis DSM 17918]|uniref:Uncharacterized protein n=1 Tax=Caldanaerobius fijiensis DSM 17918 TaxID=1121256 RepID=A0A1M5B981_9THEO|nr:hypothetical protein [Caldanaerobius fijiensis]SHF38966.1 hypothetical protein SAMN02746089_01824 [Caldanaerobius fijiensis DSM 17918]
MYRAGNLIMIVGALILAISGLSAIGNFVAPNNPLMSILRVIATVFVIGGSIMRRKK